MKPPCTGLITLQDSIGDQGARQGLAQRTDFVKGRIGRWAQPPGFHVAAMPDELLAAIHDRERG